MRYKVLGRFEVTLQTVTVHDGWWPAAGPHASKKICTSHVRHSCPKMRGNSVCQNVACSLLLLPRHTTRARMK